MDFHLVSITKPLADKDYECAWGHDTPHVIQKGKKYVRVVVKMLDGEFRSDHICVDCWVSD